MINLPLWVLPEKFPSIYDSESATAIEMVGKVYTKMRELVDSYNEFANEVNVEINQFVAQGEYDKEIFKVAMSQKFQDFIDIVELKLKSYSTERDEFVDTANNMLQTLSQINETFKTELTSEFDSHKSLVDQKLQNYERDTEVSWDEIVNKPFDAETVRGSLREIYSGSPDWSGTKTTISPTEPLKFNTEYSIVIDDDITYNCKIGSEGILGKVTFTWADKFSFTEDGRNIEFVMLDGTKPAKIRITVIEETTVTKQLEPMFIPKDINVEWDYIIDKPFGHDKLKAIYWDGDTLPHTNGVKPKFVADTDTQFYHVSDCVCAYEDALKGGKAHNSGSWVGSLFPVEVSFTADVVIKVTDDLFFIRKAGLVVAVCLKDNFSIPYTEFYEYWTNPSGARTGTLTIPKKGIYFNGGSTTVYPDTFYINDYEFEKYTPLPDELLGDVPQQIESLDTRVTELEENGTGGSGGSATLPEGAMVVKVKTFTTVTELYNWLVNNVNSVLNIIIDATPINMGAVMLNNCTNTNGGYYFERVMVAGFGSDNISIHYFGLNVYERNADGILALFNSGALQFETNGSTLTPSEPIEFNDELVQTAGLTFTVKYTV